MGLSSLRSSAYGGLDAGYWILDAIQYRVTSIQYLPKFANHVPHKTLAQT
ncbi:MAG: hypothetical protein JRJ79_14465 [Deltaproteobacteria bacterium]|nr:hypothetical protein [Deltaproteobacteria bacterium]